MPLVPRTTSAWLPPAAVALWHCVIACVMSGFCSRACRAGRGEKREIAGKCLFRGRQAVREALREGHELHQAQSAVARALVVECVVVWRALCW